MSPSIEESYARLLGRPPTAQERRELHRVGDALGIRKDDALWLVILSLTHYLEEIRQAAQQARGRSVVTSGTALWVSSLAIVFAMVLAITSRDAGYAAGYAAAESAHARQSAERAPPPCRPVASPPPLRPLSE